MDVVVTWGCRWFRLLQSSWNLLNIIKTHNNLTSELSGTTYGASAHQLRLSVTLLQNTIVKFGLSLRDPTPQLYAPDFRLLWPTRVSWLPFSPMWPYAENLQLIVCARHGNPSKLACIMLTSVTILLHCLYLTGDCSDCSTHELKWMFFLLNIWWW